jgi:hypothetical protein
MHVFDCVENFYLQDKFRIFFVLGICQITRNIQLFVMETIYVAKHYAAVANRIFLYFLLLFLFEYQYHVLDKQVLLCHQSILCFVCVS